MRMEVGQQDMLALGQSTHTPAITHMYTLMYALRQGNNDPILTQQPKTERGRAGPTMAGVTAGGMAGAKDGR